MKIAVITYTCSRDTELAARHSEILPGDWKKFWIVESKDAGLSAPAGTELIVRDFPRGGTLSGAAGIEGMRKVFLEFARAGFDAIVKLDSDTALFRPEAWTAPAEFAGTDFTYIRRWESESRLLCNGCAYTVSRRAIERLTPERFFPQGIPAKFHGAEDLIFSAFWTAFQRDLTLCQLDKNRVHWKCRPYFGADILAAHYGYLREEASALFARHLQK